MRAASLDDNVELRKRRAQPELGQGRDLILHQRNQRRDDHADAVAQQRRNLERERLAAAGGHQYQRIAAGHNVLDRFALQVAELVVAEDVLQYGGRVPRRFK